MSEEVRVTITREENFRFLVDFGPGMTTMIADEAVPIGEGTGPSPQQMLAAAVANCLSASLVFALRKFKEDPGKLTATAICKSGRNEKNRLRVMGIEVAIELGAEPADAGRLERALAQFEDFCTVSQSVKTGIPYSVTVKGPDGRILK
ncbi:MAG: OsmC family protein [Rhodomicrobium sp.]